MQFQPSTALRWTAVILAAGVAAACARSPDPVSFAADVKPLLDTHCAACHLPGQPGYEASGLGLDSYEALMKGTRYGPVVLPGDALSSVLTMLIEGRADPSINMPHGEAALPDGAQQTIRAWVEQGAKNN
jgi:hypothetical protein